MDLEPPARGPFAWLSALAAQSSKLSCSYAPVVAALIALLTVLFGVYASNHLSVDTRTDRLLDPSLAWRADEKVLNDAFPQNNHVLAVVVTGATAEIADDGALKLAAAMRQNKTLFLEVHDPAGSEFLRRNGLLFLETKQVQDVAHQLIGAQGLLGTLIADPSLNGLFGALNMTLDGITRGQITAAEVEKPIAAIADTLQPALDGEPSFLSWRTMMTGLQPDPLELHRVITVKPKLDFESLTPGEEPSAEIRKLAKQLGITPENGASVTLTGDVALDDEEFASIQEGMGVAALLSLVLVLVILFLAVRSLRAIVAIMVTLIIGLVWSLAFAALAVGALNLVSVAFIVMFIGIAVDFGIQYCVRYRDESQEAPGFVQSAERTGRSIGGSLSLAALTTSAGFLAFLPTGYKGVSELGIVAGAGMLIALLLNITLLPALIKLLNWRQLKGTNRLFASNAPDEWIKQNSARIVLLAAALILVSAAALPWLRFDFDPINLKDPNAESVKTLRVLEEAGAPGPDVMELLTKDQAGLPALSQRLEALPGVKSVMSLQTFLPSDQPQKIAIIKDAADLILPSYDLAGTTPPADDAATLKTIRETVRRLKALPDPKPAVFARLAQILDQAIAGPNPKLDLLRRSLTLGLVGMVNGLEQTLEPTGISEDTMPAEFKADWLSKDGQYRLEIMPRQAKTPGEIAQFVKSVREVAPTANGPAYFVQQAGNVVWSSFTEAFIYAFILVTLILFVALTRLLDVALVVGPLLFSALVTVAISILIGLPINFANVIALPLLMGIGVAFNIYFVANWRAGKRNPLQSSTARAVLLSAMTTLTAFGSLSLSPHAGTASMGEILTLSLFITLVTALILVPALLARITPR